MFSTRLRCRDLELPAYDSAGRTARLQDLDYLSERSVEEVYYLWTLAGGDLEAVLRKAGRIKGVDSENFWCLKVSVCIGCF